MYKYSIFLKILLLCLIMSCDSSYTPLVSVDNVIDDGTGDSSQNMQQEQDLSLMRLKDDTEALDPALLDSFDVTIENGPVSLIDGQQQTETTEQRVELQETSEDAFVFIIAVDPDGMRMEGTNNTRPTSSSINEQYLDEFYDGLTNYISDKRVALRLDTSDNSLTVLKNASSTSNSTYLALRQTCLDEIDVNETEFNNAIANQDRSYILRYLRDKVDYGLYLRFAFNRITIEEAIDAAQTHFHSQLANGILLLQCLTPAVLGAYNY